MDHALISKNPLMNISTQVSSMFSSKRFIILHVIFLSMIYFKIVFVLHVKYETNSPLEKLIYFLIEVILVCNISVLYVQLCISTVYPSVCSPTKIQFPFVTCSKSPLAILPSPIPSEKVMALHSSTLAWRIPWTEKPGRLQSMGSLRVGHD